MNDSPTTEETLRRAGMLVPEVRFLDEIERFVAADRLASPGLGGILFVGDSDIRYWDAEALRVHFAGLPVLNRGFGGARTWEVLLYFDRIVLPYRPRVIVYCAGDNDIARLKQDGAGSAVTGFRLFMEATAEHLPETRKVLYLAIHRSPSDEPLWGFIEEANAELRPLCRQSRLADYVDYLHLLAQPDGRLREDCFASDRLHFTAEFYGRLGAYLRPAVEAALIGALTSRAR
jgi:hypothetical protein